MCSLRQGGYVFTLFFLFVSRVAQNYSIDFHRIRWKGDTLATENPLDFGGNPDHVT